MLPVKVRNTESYSSLKKKGRYNRFKEMLKNDNISAVYNIKNW